MQNFPGPAAWIARAVVDHGAKPGHAAAVLGIDPFLQFCDLIGQACAQPFPDVRGEQVGHAVERLAPLRVALAAAEAILADVEASIAAEAEAQADGDPLDEGDPLDDEPEPEPTPAPEPTHAPKPRRRR